MSSVLDQSLDEIIGSKPRKTLKKKTPVAKSKVTKATVAPKKAATKKTTKPAAAPRVLDASFATKVIVYGLPKDIKNDAVKDFFASQVGGVSGVSLQYNEKGQSKGIATVEFKSSSSASKAVEKYNGAPIDGGAQKLRLELIIDPTKKPLANRIVANTGAAPKKEQPKKANAKKGGEQKPQQQQQKKKTENKPKNKRPAKKTVEQLDQEMADYFEKKD